MSISEFKSLYFFSASYSYRSFSSQPEVIAEHCDLFPNTTRRYNTKNTLKALVHSVFLSVQKSINLGFLKRSTQKVDGDSLHRRLHHRMFYKGGKVRVCELNERGLTEKYGKQHQRLIHGFSLKAE